MSEKPSAAISAYAASFKKGATPGRSQPTMSPEVAALAKSYAKEPPPEHDSPERQELRRFLARFGDQHGPRLFITGLTFAEANRFATAFGAELATQYARDGLDFEAACQKHKATGLKRKPLVEESCGNRALGKFAARYR